MTAALDEARGAASGTRASGARTSTERGASGAFGSIVRCVGVRGSTRDSRGSGRVIGSGRPVELAFTMCSSPSSVFLNQAIVKLRS